MVETARFIDLAFSLPSVAQGGKIKCPCAKCRNYFPQEWHIVEEHLYKHGYKPNYKTWTEHGESFVATADGSVPLVHQEGCNELIEWTKADEPCILIDVLDATET